MVLPHIAAHHSSFYKMRFSLIFLLYFFFSSIGSLNAQQTKDAVRSQVESQLSALRLLPDDFEQAISSDDFSSGGLRYVYYQQIYRGVKVFNGLLNAVVRPSGKVEVTGNRFVHAIKKSAGEQQVRVSASEALRSAFRHLELDITAAPQVLKRTIAKGSRNIYQQTIFAAAGPVEEDIPAELVWTNTGEKVILCWNIRIRLKSNWWEVRVSAIDGSVLEKNNWVLHCSFDHAPLPEVTALPETESREAMMGANDYQVFDLPLTSPIEGNRTIVNSPWSRAGQDNKAVSLQWHNDGTKTYTNTRGNNVFAKDDIAADNESSIGYSPVSPNLEFVFPFTEGAVASVNRDAAITNLFFWNNICHDIFYQYGFDEVSGNFQLSNQGRGGAGNDFVYADGLDGSGTNNANFATPPDGSAPRMQMFLWNASGATSQLLVNSPAGIAGGYPAATAFFNPSSPSSITGNIIVSSPAEGCSALSNASAVAGKIVVINRGTCTFVTKVKNAQNAGAIGVIIVNNVAGAPIGMSGTDPTINILSCMVSTTTGNQLKAALQNGAVNATIQANQSGSASLDANFDNGVIVHEYGHGVSNRLTGGPSAASCLSNAEQMGEGWSDYFALMFCTDWTKAQPNDARAMGNYLIGQGSSGGGIRDYPYSYDMAVSPYNYNFARTNTAVHDLGSAWASMLWDMTWNIIAMKPASADLYQGTGGNNIALRLVMEGLKLQPCNPGFVDGRDAILKADEILFNNEHRCAIWNAFARRGLGVSASQGSRNSASDGSQAFDAPEGLSLSVNPSVDLLAPGDTVDFSLNTLCGCTDSKGLKVNATLSSRLDFVSSSNGSYNPATRTVSFPAFDLTVTQRDTQMIRTIVNNSFSQPTIQFSDDAENGTSKWNAVKLSGTGNSTFSIGSNNVKSGSKSWFVPATIQPTLTALVLSEPLMIMPDALMSFWHYHKVEPDYDGSVVEISTDNGSTWQDLGNNMTRNSYNGTIAITDNALQGRKVFTGEEQMRQTVINLSDYSGQEVLIRFVYGSDTQNGALPTAIGWFIDDIQITSNDTCILVKATAGNQSSLASAQACVSVEAVEPVITGNDQSAISPVLVYPNPADEVVWINLNSENKNAMVRLYTITGLKLQEFSIQGGQSTPLRVDQLPPAPYLLEVNISGKSRMFRLITY